MQSTGILALSRLSSSPECAEILAVDQLGAVQRRGHVAYSKNCSWPSGIILSRISLDRDFFINLEPELWHLFPLLDGGWDWSTPGFSMQLFISWLETSNLSEQKNNGKLLSYFSKLKNTVLIICNIVVGSRNWDSTHLLDTICLEIHKLFLNGGELQGKVMYCSLILDFSALECLE